jgi:hypothetical protein
VQILQPQNEQRSTVSLLDIAYMRRGVLRISLMLYIFRCAHVGVGTGPTQRHQLLADSVVLALLPLL